MKIHRSHPRERFTIIPDETLRDERLSYLARGVLAELLSRPDDWQTTADALWRRGRHARGNTGEGRAVLRAAFAELEACGYLQRTRRRTIGGRIVTDMHVYDVPAGRTDDQTGGPRSGLGKHESAQVAPTTSTPGVGQPGVGQPGVGVLVVSTETYNGNGFELRPDDENGNSLSRIAAALTAAGGTERESKEVINRAQADPRIRNAIAWLTASVSNGDAPALLAEVRYDAARAAAAEAAPDFPWFGHQPRPPWCGQCHESTRMLEDDEGRPYRCPDCHPLTAEDGAA
jgi:hypothetical protein